MSDSSMPEKIRTVIEKDPRYPFDAYRFVFESLDHSVRTIGVRRHITGQELLAGIREYALEQFGGLARMVLSQWGIARTQDFGEIVFNLVAEGLMGKTETDSKEDFRDGYDFDEAFPLLYEPPPEEETGAA